MYIYIYIKREREREKKRKRKREREKEKEREIRQANQHVRSPETCPAPWISTASTCEKASPWGPSLLPKILSYASVAAYSLVY